MFDLCLVVFVFFFQADSDVFRRFWHLVSGQAAAWLPNSTSLLHSLGNLTVSIATLHNVVFTQLEDVSFFLSPFAYIYSQRSSIEEGSVHYFVVYEDMPSILLCMKICHQFCCVWRYAINFVVYEDMPSILLCMKICHGFNTWMVFCRCFAALTKLGSCRCPPLNQLTCCSSVKTRLIPVWTVWLRFVFWPHWPLSIQLLVVGIFSSSSTSSFSSSSFSFFFFIR